MTELDSMSFSGRTYRILSAQSAVWVDYFQLRLIGEEPPVSVDLPIDHWDFSNEPKLGPAVLYRRVLPPWLDPLQYFTGNKSGALVFNDSSVLDASSQPRMADDDFWLIVETPPHLSWAHRIERVVKILQLRSVSDILGFHRTLVSKLSELAHPLRSVLIGDFDTEDDETEAAIAAILLEGREAFESHLKRIERLDQVDGLEEGNVLDISRRALREGHGINARVVLGTPLPEADDMLRASPQSAEERERELAYRERVHGFRDPDWDSDRVAEWLSARALVQTGEGAEELVLLVARLVQEDLPQLLNRVLDRAAQEGALVTEIELARPLINRPGFRTPPFFGIATPKTSSLPEYLVSAGYSTLESASVSFSEANPRWARFPLE